MFTIKHVEKNGHESIRQAKMVCRDSIDASLTPLDGQPFQQNVYAEVDGEPLCYGSGDIFVMNDSGKTVAVYHLGYPPTFESKS